MQKLPKNEWNLYKANLALKKRFAQFTTAIGAREIFQLTLTVPYRQQRDDTYLKSTLLDEFVCNLVKTYGVQQYLWTAKRENDSTTFTILVAGTQQPTDNWKQLWHKHLMTAIGYEWLHNGVQVYAAAPVTDAQCPVITTANRITGKSWGCSRLGKVTSDQCSVISEKQEATP